MNMLGKENVQDGEVCSREEGPGAVHSLKMCLNELLPEIKVGADKGTSL